MDPEYQCGTVVMLGMAKMELGEANFPVLCHFLAISPCFSFLRNFLAKPTKRKSGNDILFMFTFPIVHYRNVNFHPFSGKEKVPIVP